MAPAIRYVPHIMSEVAPRYADLDGAATYSGYKRRQLYEFVRIGLLPAYQPNGGKLLIDLHELDVLIKSKRHDPRTRLDKIVEETLKEIMR